MDIKFLNIGRNFEYETVFLNGVGQSYLSGDWLDIVWFSVGSEVYGVCFGSKEMNYSEIMSEKLIDKDGCLLNHKDSKNSKIWDKLLPLALKELSNNNN